MMSSLGGGSIGGGHSRGRGGRMKHKWENDKRHYCSICNAWMGSDKQSIMLHENGKKHKENLQFQLSEKRKEKANKQHQEKQLQDALKEINQAAELKTKTAQDMIHYGRTSWEEKRPGVNVASSGNYATGHPQREQPTSTSAISATGIPPPELPRPASNSSHSVAAASSYRNEASTIPKPSNIQLKRALGGGGTVSISLNPKDAKRKPGTLSSVSSSSVNLLSSIPLRQEEEHANSDTRITGLNETQSETTGAPRPSTSADVGHYELDGITFLKGDLFAPLLEEEMTVQIWTGALPTHSDCSVRTMNKTSHSEMLRPEMKDSWKDGIVVKVHSPAEKDTGEFSVRNKNKNNDPIVSCDVAYLKQPDDDDETLEHRVDPQRLRIPLDQNDDMVPSSIEEATAALHSITKKSYLSDEDDNNREAATTEVIEEEIDENTGFTKFKTISVTRTTKYEEERQKREQERQKRRDAEINKLKEAKEMQQRKQEEEKHSSVDDSALGAYDVFSSNSISSNHQGSSSKKGSSYKGIDINSSSTDKRDVTDLVKPLAQGKQNVTFKKRSTNSSFKAGGKDKKRNVRRKTIDDD